MARPLKVGVVLPLAEDGTPGREPGWPGVRSMALRAEELGFDSLWVSDHFRWSRPGMPLLGPLETFTVLNALAASTTRVEIGPWVTCTPFRNPALLAKMAATLDEISGGRLILGLGTGWHEGELRAVGAPLDHPVARFEEAATIIRTLLREGRADLHGRWHSVDHGELIPRGPRNGAIPLLFGAKGPRMLELTARLADAWNAWATWKDGVYEVPAAKAVLDAACGAIGRDPATLERTAGIEVVFRDARPAGTPAARHLAGEDPARLAASLASAAEAGVGHVMVTLNPETPRSLDLLGRSLSHLDAA